MQLINQAVYHYYEESFLHNPYNIKKQAFIPGWSLHWQSGQKTNRHLGELHSAFVEDTRLGLVHNGHWTNLSPGVKFLAWSTKSMCRTLEGDTKDVEDEQLSRSRFVEFGEVWFLILENSRKTRRGDIRFLSASTPKFSLSFLTLSIYWSRRLLCSEFSFNARFQNWDTLKKEKLISTLTNRCNLL